MKKLVVFSVFVLALASCSSVQNTSKTLDIATSMSSAGQADLQVSPTKTTYVWNVESKDRRLGTRGVMEKAVALTLKNAGNADVLVTPEFEITRRGGKIRQIIITGYPATYTNFRSSK